MYNEFDLYAGLTFISFCIVNVPFEGILSMYIVNLPPNDLLIRSGSDIQDRKYI